MRLAVAVGVVVAVLDVAAVGAVADVADTEVAMTSQRA
jgi:hypothetical protein